MPGPGDDDGGAVGELDGFGDTGGVVRGGVGGTVCGGVVRGAGAVVGRTGGFVAGADLGAAGTAGPVVPPAETVTYRRRAGVGSVEAAAEGGPVVGAAVVRSASAGVGLRDVLLAPGASPRPLPSAEFEPENGLLPRARTSMASAQVTAKTIRVETVRM